MNPPRGLCLGLDLTSSARKPSIAAFVDGLPRLIALDFLSDDAQILAEIERHRPILVAIDAPLSLPLGLHCLDERHPCRAFSEATGRQCERELSKTGIGLFWTTKRSLIKPMIKRAVDLRGRLEAKGFTVIEIYPHATAVVLLGRRLPKKSKTEGRRSRQRGLLSCIEGMPDPQRQLLSHDQLDALLAAYTGYLFTQGRARGIGDPEEGLIYIPA